LGAGFARPQTPRPGEVWPGQHNSCAAIRRAFHPDVEQASVLAFEAADHALQTQRRALSPGRRIDLVIVDVLHLGIVHTGSVVGNLDHDLAVRALRPDPHRYRARERLDGVDDRVFDQRLEQHARHLQLV